MSSKDRTTRIIQRDRGAKPVALVWQSNNLSRVGFSSWDEDLKNGRVGLFEGVKKDFLSKEATSDKKEIDFFEGISK